MKLWLDDEREAPSGWHWVKTAPECIKALRRNAVTHLSLDHDLGAAHYAGKYPRGTTGYDVLCYIESVCLLTPPGPLAVPPIHCPPEIFIHTANPVGRKRMVQVCEKLQAAGLTRYEVRAVA